MSQVGPIRIKLERGPLFPLSWRVGWGKLLLAQKTAELRDGENGVHDDVRI